MFKNIALSLIAFALTITMVSPSFGAFGGGPVFERNIGIFNDGTSTRPSITFSRETDLGFYRSGTNAVSFVGGTLTATMALVGDICVDDAAGSCLMDEAALATNPTLVPNRADPDTGIGWVQADWLAIVTNGAETARIGQGQVIASPLNTGPALYREVASSTNPTLLPRWVDSHTGIGWAADTIHLIGGGISEAQIGVAGTIFNNGGLNRNFRVASDNNANMFVIDGGNDIMGIGGPIDTNSIIKIHRPKAKTMAVGANDQAVAINMAAAGYAVTTAGSGTHAQVATLWVDEPNITIGTAGVTTAATVLINAAPTEATNNYALFVDAGAVQFDGTLDVSGDVNFDGGSFIFNEGGNDHDMKWESSDHSNILFMDADINRIILFGASVASAGSITFYHSGTNEPRIIIADSSGETIRLATTAGETTVFNDQGTNIDFRVESANLNAFTVDAAKDSVNILGGNADNNSPFRVGAPARTATADAWYQMALFSPDGSVTIPSGTAGIVATVHITEPNITATGTVTAASTLYIQNAPTEGASNYALWVDAGDARFDGNLLFVDGETISRSSTDQMFFRLNGSTSGGKWQFNLGASNNNVLMLEQTGDGPGLTVFNQDGIDRDFRVEGTTSDHLLFVDSGNDSVSIGVNDITPTVTVNQPFAVFANDATTQTLMYDNGLAGQWTVEYRIDGKGDGKVLWLQNNFGLDSADNETNYGQFYVQTVLDNSGAETSRYSFSPSVAGSTTEVMSVTGAVGDVGINVGGIIRVTDAAGPAMLNDAAEQTVPTLVPNRADTDTGIGWKTSNELSLISGGVSVAILHNTLGMFMSLDLYMQDNFLSFGEAGSAPSGLTDQARIFAVDNGSGKTKLMVVFGSGSAVQLAIEP
jgi:hypothetical protein